MSKYLPMCCNESDMREAAAKICRDFLHGAWKTVSPQDLDFRRISGGLSNFLYYVALPEKKTGSEYQNGSPEYRPEGEEKKATLGSLLRDPLTRQTSFNLEEPKKVLVRIYGQTQSERGVDNIIMDSVIFTLLSERRLGPKLHGVFSGGRIEEFIPARQLFTRELSEPAMSMKIAEKMALIHLMEVPLCKEPQWLWKKMGRWLTAALTNLENHTTENSHEQESVDKLRSYNLEKEVSWLRNYLSTVDSPVVFCHNDLQEGNILLREDLPHHVGDDTNDDLNVDYSTIDHDSSSDSFLTSRINQNGTNSSTPNTPQKTDVPGVTSGEMFRSIVSPESVEDSRGITQADTISNRRPSRTLPSNVSPELNRMAIDTVEDNTCDTTDSDGSLINGEPRLVIIDYEYCAYNHRGFDLANHFVEWAYDYTNPDFPYFTEQFNCYPTLEQKEIFMRQYLSRVRQTSSASTDYAVPSLEEVNRLNHEVEAYSMASHLFWTLWAIVHAAKCQIPFGYWDYGVSRMEWYSRLKQEVIKKDPNGPSLKRKIREVDI